MPKMQKPTYQNTLEAIRASGVEAESLKKLKSLGGNVEI